MNHRPLAAHPFQAGGALGQGSLYVRRTADDDLFGSLSAGYYCHVLAPRQIGKTSLCVRVAARLREAGAQVAFVDLSALGVTASFDQWLYAVASEIARPVGAAAELDAHWQREPTLPASARFVRFLSEVLVPRFEGSLVIFVDEIDAVLERNLPAELRLAEATEFFWAIRSLHNLRARRPEQERLVFCLSGVASPADLLQNAGKSPFVVSRAIELRDFCREELGAFEPHLCPESPDRGALLDEIWAWTSGHPYMVQHLCEEITSADLCAAAARPEDVVRSAVDRRFLGPRRRDDAVLQFASNYLSRRNRAFPLARMLSVVRQMLEGGRLRFDPRNDAHLRLMLAGLARTQEDGADVLLVIRNRIVKEVFDRSWVGERESELHLGEPLLRWLQAPEDKKESLVLRGAVLRDVLEWQKTRADIQPQERDFIEASLQVELREREQQVELERRGKETELAEAKRQEADDRAKRTRRFNVVLGASLAVITGLGILLAVAYAKAQRQWAALEEASNDLREESQRTLTLLRLEREADLVARVAGIESKDSSRPTSEAVLVRALKSIGPLMEGMDDMPAASAEDMTLVTPLVVLLNEAPLLRWSFGAKTGSAQAVAFSPDGQRLVVGDDGGATLWNLGTGNRISDLLASPAESIRAAAISPDGKLVVTGGKGGRLDVWDGATGRSVGALRGHARGISSIRVLRSNRILTSGEDGMVQLQAMDGSRQELHAATGKEADAVAVSPDEAVLAAGSEEGAIHLWGSEGTAAGRLTGHTGGVYDLAFSPDGKLLVSGSADGTARVWNVAAKKLVCTASGHSDPVGSVAFSPDGESIVTGSYDGTARSWDSHTCTPRWRSDAASTPLVRIAFLADGARAATAGTDGYIRILDAADGRLLSTLFGHTGAVRDMAVSSDGGRVAAASMDGRATVWAVPDGRPVLEMRARAASGAPGEAVEARPAAEQRARDIEYSPDGKRLFAAYGTGFVRVWSADTGALLHAERAHEGAVRRLVVVPSGDRFATVGADGKSFLWKAQEPFSRRELPLSGAGAPGEVKPPCRPLDGSAKGQVAAELDPSGALLAAGGADCLVRVWDVATGELRAVFSGHESEVLALSFSAGGQLLASEDARGVVRVWDVSAGRERRSIPTLVDPEALDSSPVAVIRFLSEDRLLTGIKYESARIWDVRSGAEVADLKAAGHWLLDVAPSAPRGAEDSRWLVTSSWDQSVRVWDAVTGDLRLSLWGHEGPVRKSFFSRDGAVIWTASEDERLRAWDAKKGVLLGEIHAGVGDLWDIELSPDGRHIASADARGTVRVFPATLRGFFIQACQLLRGRPSHDEVESVCAAHEDEQP